MSDTIAATLSLETVRQIVAATNSTAKGVSSKPMVADSEQALLEDLAGLAIEFTFESEDNALNADDLDNVANIERLSKLLRERLSRLKGSTIEMAVQHHFRELRCSYARSRRDLSNEKSKSAKAARARRVNQQHHKIQEAASMYADCDPKYPDQSIMLGRATFIIGHVEELANYTRKSLNLVEEHKSKIKVWYARKILLVYERRFGAKASRAIGRGENGDEPSPALRFALACSRVVTNETISQNLTAQAIASIWRRDKIHATEGEANGTSNPEFASDR